MDRPLRETLADIAAKILRMPLIALLFLLRGGPVAMWCYKAVSTTDSMWGCAPAVLAWLGRGSDDALAYVPARLAACAVRPRD